MTDQLSPTEWHSFRIELSGQVTRHELDDAVQQLCQKRGVSDLEQIESQEIQFDLQQARFLDLDAALWLLMILQLLRSRRNIVRLQLPKVESALDSQLWSFLLRWDFFGALRRLAGPVSNFLGSEQTLLLDTDSLYRKPRQIRDERGKLVDVFTPQLFAISTLAIEPLDPLKPQLDAFAWPLQDVLLLTALAQRCGIPNERAGSLISFMSEEAVQNTRHAGGKHVLCCMQTIDHKNKLASYLNTGPVLRIAIADNGSGIPSVLRQAIDQGIIKATDVPDAEAAQIQYFASRELSADAAKRLAEDNALTRIATQEHITSEPGAEGMGLHNLVKFAEQMSANVTIRSGRGEVTFVTGGTPVGSSSFCQALGTLIVIDIPIVR